MAALPENDRLAGPYIAEAGQRDFAADFPLIKGQGLRARIERGGAMICLSGTQVEPINPEEHGFTCRLAQPAQAGDRVWIFSLLPTERDRSHTPHGAVRTLTLEDDAEEQQAQHQEVRRDLDRALTAPLGELGLELPPRAVRAGRTKVIGSNPDGELTLLDGALFKGDPGGNVLAIGLFAALSGLNVPLGTEVIQSGGYERKGVGVARYVEVDAGPETSFRKQTANGRWFEILEPELTPQMVGAIGDGETDDTQAISNAWSVGRPVFLPEGRYRVGALTPPAGSHTTFGPGARLVAAAPGVVIQLNQSDVTILGADIDLAYTASCAIKGGGTVEARLSGLKLIGPISVRNAAPGGDGRNGGVVLSYLQDAVIGDIHAENLWQFANHSLGAYRALELSSSVRCLVGDVTLRGGDMCCFPFGSQQSTFGALSAFDITDNGLYVAGAARDLTFESVNAQGCGEGVVLHSTLAECNVVVASASIRAVTANGVTLRTGSGYHIGTLSLHEGQLAQSSSYLPGVSGLTIGSVRQFVDTLPKTPAVFNQNRRISIGTYDIICTQSPTTEALRVVDCDDFNIGVLRVLCLGGAPIQHAVRILNGAAPVASPRIVIGQLSAEGVVTPYRIDAADRSRIVINQGPQRTGDLVLTSSQSARLQLRSELTSQASGGVLGRVEAFNSDSSGPGVKGALTWRAAGGNGAGGRMEIENDAGEVVGVVPTGQGMSIKLPTSSAGLSSGMIWLNAGAIAVVP